MSQVLLVTTNYWPEPTGISVYTTDLAESLKAVGNSVTVLTSLPHYPWWRIPAEYSHMVEGKSEQSGVFIIRAKHLIPPKMNALIRIRFESSLWWNLRRISKEFKTGDFDAIVACVPTVAAGIVGKRIAKKLRIPFGLIVQDLSGAGAKQSGLRGGALISKIAHFVEGRALHAANGLVVVSPAMRDVVVGLGVEKSRISQILNYSARSIVAIEKADARRRFSWPADDFIVIHTGNMGAKQDLENVVKSADFLGSNSQIKIYLVGHGNQESTLKTLCKGKSNISVLPAVSDADYSALLSAADLLLVNERSTQLEMSLPSKLTSYLYSQRAVIAAVPRGGATWKFLDGVAELVEAGDPIALARAIEELSQEPEKLADLAKRGRVFADANLDSEVGRKKYLNWVAELVQSK
ncbi:glycosyltransferase WbuB [Actinobacteria bacterium IMCC26103]|nr:glycosyltransferase WbuB [Actinobacteria bacterium IMCC26103]